MRKAFGGLGVQFGAGIHHDQSHEARLFGPARPSNAVEHAHVRYLDVGFRYRPNLRRLQLLRSAHVSLGLRHGRHCLRPLYERVAILSDEQLGRRSGWTNPDLERDVDLDAAPMGFLCPLKEMPTECVRAASISYFSTGFINLAFSLLASRTSLGSFL